MTGLVDLNPAHLAIVEHILAEHVPECEVRAFGSRATWNAKDHSDLDLVVVGDEPLPRRTLIMLQEAFEESRLPMRVDVVDWNTTASDFRELIDSDTVVVQDAASPNPWPVVRLGDCIVTNDDTVSPKDAWTYIHYLDTGNIIENRIDEIQHLVVGEDKIPTRARRKVQAGDIVYSTVRPNQRHYGLLKDIPENLLASTGFVVIRGKEGVVHTDFVYWLLVQDYIVDYLQAIAEHSTSTYPSIRPSDIDAIEIPLPPLEEQRRIARILGALDAKIELNQCMNETLEEMSRALFKSWFADFDPVRAKMEGRDTGLPCYLASLFPDRLVDSELGEIPEGWIIGSLGDIAASQRRGVDPATVASDMPYIGLKHMPRRSIALTDWDEAGSVSSAKSAFEVGDILFGKLRPYFHKVGISPVDGLCSTDIVVLKTRVSRWSAFVLACVSSSEFVAHTSQTSTGTKMPRTSWQAMSTYELCQPTDVVATEFQDVVSPMLRRIIGNIHNSRTLAALRNTLLPKLISGEIRVSHVDRVWESET